MADILQTTFFNAFTGMKIILFGFKISLKFVLKVPIDNWSALIQGWDSLLPDGKYVDQYLSPYGIIAPVIYDIFEFLAFHNVDITVTS